VEFVKDRKTMRRPERAAKVAPCPRAALSHPRQHLVVGGSAPNIEPDLFEQGPDILEDAILKAGGGA
jgi:hypothetical protein